MRHPSSALSTNPFRIRRGIGSFRAIWWALAGCLVLPMAAYPDDASKEGADRVVPVVGPDSLVRLTFEHNLRVTAARYDVDATEYQFLRYERNRSQFRPLIVESGVARDLESEIIGSERREEYEDVGRVAVGMEKEFFDGTRIGGSTGYRSVWDQDETNGNPFVEFAGRFPLFSSFTRLERVTERSFEESEMLGSWLNFIETVRETISDSYQTYFELQGLIALQSIAQSAYDDIESLMKESEDSVPQRDLNQMRDQLQAYQSRLVERKGDIAAKRIELLDNVGLAALPLEKIEILNVYSDDLPGSQYLVSNPQELLARALDSDVEMKVLEIARDNALLKISLAERGKWDIIGRIFGSYDFDSTGDNPSRRRGYQAGIAFTVERNDPKLLMLSLRGAQAEERRFTALLDYRERQLENEIDRRFGQATSMHGVVRELKLSQDSRRAVFDEKRTAYLDSDESLDNVIRARGELFSTERDLIDSLDDYFEVIVDLDEASGAYYAQLEDELGRLQNLGNEVVREAAKD